MQKMGVICDSSRSNEVLASSDTPDIRQEVSAPGHAILLVSLLLCSTGLTDQHQKLHEWSTLNILLTTRCEGQTILRCIHLDDSVLVVGNPDAPIVLNYLPIVRGR